MQKIKVIKGYLRSVPYAQVLSIIGVLVGLIGSISTTAVDSNPGSIDWHRFFFWLTILFFCGLLLIAIQTHLRYRKEKYDPILALKYQDEFLGMEDKRSKAAVALKNRRNNLAEIFKNKEELDCIDAILDFLDDLGFYLEGDQISAEVMHQHFYYWIRGYWLACRPYIEKWQSQENESPRWNHIKDLFEETCEVETSGNEILKKKEYAYDVAEFLYEEIGSADEK